MGDGVGRFEDLTAWPRARSLAGKVHALTRTSPFAQDFGPAGQIQRAAVSMMSNIAERFERSRPTEFHQHLSTAKGSSGDVRSHLHAALDAGSSPRAMFESLLADAEEVGRIIGGLRAAVERQKA